MVDRLVKDALKNLIVENLLQALLALAEAYKKLEHENERLRRVQNNNSGNSSLPSLKDQKLSESPNQYNSRGKFGKRKGG